MGDTGLVQSVKHVTFDLQDVNSSPTLVVEITLKNKIFKNMFFGFFFEERKKRKKRIGKCLAQLVQAWGLPIHPDRGQEKGFSEQNHQPPNSVILNENHEKRQVYLA